MVIVTSFFIIIIIIFFFGVVVVVKTLLWVYFDVRFVVGAAEGRRFVHFFFLFYLIFSSSSSSLSLSLSLSFFFLSCPFIFRGSLGQYAVPAATQPNTHKKLGKTR